MSPSSPAAGRGRSHQLAYSRGENNYTRKNTKGFPVVNSAVAAAAAEARKRVSRVRDKVLPNQKRAISGPRP